MRFFEKAKFVKYVELTLPLHMGRSYLIRLSIFCHEKLSLYDGWHPLRVTIQQHFTSAIWPDKRDGLWWEWPYKTGTYLYILTSKCFYSKAIYSQDKCILNHSGNTMATKHQIHDLKRMLIREQNNFNTLSSLF